MADYEVWLTDAHGNLLDVISDWITLNYTRSLNAIGVATIILNGDYSPFEYIKLDGRIVIQRDGIIDTDTVFFIRDINRILNNKGQQLISVEGLSAVELLNRRIVAYNSDTAYTNKSGAADDIIKAIIRENLGGDATDGNRDISAYMTVQADTSQGPTITKEFARDNVLDICTEISQATIQAGSAVFYDVQAPSYDTLQFRTYRGLRGTDHSWSTGDEPVILSPERGNLVTLSREYDYREEITYVYAGGEGFGDVRNIETASSQERIDQSPLNRREVFVNVSNASGSSASDAHLDEAKSVLRSGRPRRTFSGQLVNVTGTEYGTHWNWGDKLTAEYEGESINCIVDTVQISIQKGKETIGATLRVAEDE